MYEENQIWGSNFEVETDTKFSYSEHSDKSDLQRERMREKFQPRSGIVDV